MNPVVLENGTWFDADDAARWERKFEFDGSDSGELTRQVLWRTKKGTFILENWMFNSWKGCELLSRREHIPEDVGIVWLLSAKETIPKDLSQKVQEIEL